MPRPLYSSVPWHFRARPDQGIIDIRDLDGWTVAQVVAGINPPAMPGNAELIVDAVNTYLHCGTPTGRNPIFGIQGAIHAHLMMTLASQSAKLPLDDYIVLLDATIDAMVLMANDARRGIDPRKDR